MPSTRFVRRRRRAPAAAAAAARAARCMRACHTVARRSWRACREGVESPARRCNAQNAARTADYSTAVLGGHFPVHRGHIFDQDDLLRAVMIEELMCNFSILRDTVAARLGGIPANFAPLLAQAAQEFPGMVTLDDAGLHVLPIGQPLTRLIARSFDSYDQGRAQHSAAI